MIWYNYEKEAWVDDKDPLFKISMSCEDDGTDDLDREYSSRAEFLEWYNS